MQPGDVTVSPGAASEYFVGAVATDGRGWTILGAEPTWPLALRKGCLIAGARKGRVLASRRGDKFEIADPEHIWISLRLGWHAFNHDSVSRFAPELPGVYMVRSMTPLLIGETANLRARLLYHVTTPDACLDVERPTQFYCEVFEAPGLRAFRLRELVSWWEPLPCSANA